jgi:hypothetical protein
VEIEFLVQHGDTHLPYDRAVAEASELSETVQRPWDLEGRWRLAHEDYAIEWDDTLVPLVQAVCLDAVRTLLTTGHAVASRTIEYGYLRMDVEGEWVRLGGDGLPSGRVPIQPFVEGQMRCAGQLVNLLLALGQDGFDARALREDRREVARAWAGGAPQTAGPDMLGPIPTPLPRREADGPMTLEQGEALVLHCGPERFTFPGDPTIWMQRLVDEVLPILSPDVHAVLSQGEHYGWLRIDGEGDRVRLSGDGLGDLRVPREAFAGTLQNIALS